MTTGAMGFVVTNNEGPSKPEAPQILSDYTRYGRGGESWEHDNTGHVQNLSGCWDDMMTPIAEHEGWQEGYDY